MEAKRLDFEKRPFTFEANGNKYHSTQTMSIDRYIEFDRLQAHVGFGNDFKNLYDKMKESYEHMNKMKMADAAVIIHNLMNGIAQNLDKRDHPSLQMCALFLNREGENAAVFDEDLMAEKINDWKKEGYAMQDFFRLAISFVDGFYDAYEEISQSISALEERVASSIGKKD